MAPTSLKYLIAGFALFGLAGCVLLGGLFSGGGSSSGTSATTATASTAVASAPSLVDEVEPSSRIGLLSPDALLVSNPSIDPDKRGSR